MSAHRRESRITAVTWRKRRCLSSGHRSHLSRDIVHTRSQGVNDGYGATGRHGRSGRGPPEERGRPRVRGLPAVGDHPGAALPGRGRGRPGAPFTAAVDQSTTDCPARRGRDRRATQGTRPRRAQGTRANQGKDVPDVVLTLGSGTLGARRWGGHLGPASPPAAGRRPARGPGGHRAHCCGTMDGCPSFTAV